MSVSLTPASPAGSYMFWTQSSRWSRSRVSASRVRCPVLAVQGENDEYGTMAQLDELAASVRGPVSQLRLADCGHSPHRDREETVREAILALPTARDPEPPPNPEVVELIAAGAREIAARQTDKVPVGR